MEPEIWHIALPAALHAEMRWIGKTAGETSVWWSGCDSSIRDADGAVDHSNSSSRSKSVVLEEVSWSLRASSGASEL